MDLFLFHLFKVGQAWNTGGVYCAATIHLVLGRATAQHMQDCPIFFIQLNYVHNNNKEMGCYHLMLNSPAVKWHSTVSLNSAILHNCNFGHSCLYLFNVSFSP